MDGGGISNGGGDHHHLPCGIGLTLLRDEQNSVGVLLGFVGVRLISRSSLEVLSEFSQGSLGFLLKFSWGSLGVLSGVAQGHGCFKILL